MTRQLQNEGPGSPPAGDPMLPSSSSIQEAWPPGTSEKFLRCSFRYCSTGSLPDKPHTHSRICCGSPCSLECFNKSTLASQGRKGRGSISPDESLLVCLESVCSCNSWLAVPPHSSRNRLCHHKQRFMSPDSKETEGRMNYEKFQVCKQFLQ